MAHRLQAVATGMCGRLGRSPSLISGRGRVQSSAAYSYTSVHEHAEQKIISACVTRPATSSYTLLGGDQYRQYHNTPINREGGENTAAATDNEQPIAPFKSPKVEALFQKIIWLDMVEVHLLAELINEKMGITISDAERERIARGGSGGGGGKKDASDDAPAEVVEEKTVFDLKLTAFDAKSKIKVIKEVRAITSLGLKEAKELVEGVPATIKKDIKKEEAEELKTKLEGLGATIEIA